MEQEIKELLKSAVSVARWRRDDLDFDDVSYATTDIDQMIFLEEAIQTAFGIESSEIIAIFKKIEKL